MKELALNTFVIWHIFEEFATFTATLHKNMSETNEILSKKSENFPFFAQKFIFLAHSVKPLWAKSL
jgi:hypothetical protein